MNCTTSTALATVRATAVLPALATLAVLAAVVVASEQTTIADGRTVEGTWFVQVTPRNCDTNAPLGSFNSLVTFARGGTLSETPASLSFAPGQRSPGHGTWSRESHHTFSQRFVALILFGTAPNPPMTPGFEAGWQTVTHTVELSDADHYTSAGSNKFFRSNGDVYRTGCSTAIGVRFD
jgi:hypothetical protein